MPTNIIHITNTITNFINLPAEVTNSILKVAELPAKPWWEIALMIGAPALTALSAWLMWRSVEEMKRQRVQSYISSCISKIEQFSFDYEESGDVNLELNLNLRIPNSELFVPHFKELHLKHRTVGHACVFYYNNIHNKNYPDIAATWNNLMHRNIKDFISFRENLKQGQPDGWRKLQQLSGESDPEPLGVIEKYYREITLKKDPHQ